MRRLSSLSARPLNRIRAGSSSSGVPPSSALLFPSSLHCSGGCSSSSSSLLLPLNSSSGASCVGGAAFATTRVLLQSHNTNKKSNKMVDEDDDDGGFIDVDVTASGVPLTPTRPPSSTAPSHRSATSMSGGGSGNSLLDALADDAIAAESNGDDDYSSSPSSSSSGLRRPEGEEDDGKDESVAFSFGKLAAKAEADLDMEDGAVDSGSSSPDAEFQKAFESVALSSKDVDAADEIPPPSSPKPLPTLTRPTYIDVPPPPRRQQHYAPVTPSPKKEDEEGAASAGGGSASASSASTTAADGWYAGAQAELATAEQEKSFDVEVGGGDDDDIAAGGASHVSGAEMKSSGRPVNSNGSNSSHSSSATSTNSMFSDLDAMAELEADESGADLGAVEIGDGDENAMEGGGGRAEADSLGLNAAAFDALGDSSAAAAADGDGDYNAAVAGGDIPPTIAPPQMSPEEAKLKEENSLIDELFGDVLSFLPSDPIVASSASGAAAAGADARKTDRAETLAANSLPSSSSSSLMDAYAADAAALSAAPAAAAAPSTSSRFGRKPSVASSPSSAPLAAAAAVADDIDGLTIEASTEIGVGLLDSFGDALLGGGGIGGGAAALDGSGLGGAAGEEGKGALPSSPSSATAAAAVAAGRLSDPNTDLSFYTDKFKLRVRPLCRGIVVAWYPEKGYGLVADAEDIETQTAYLADPKALSNLITAAAVSGGPATAADPLAGVFKTFRALSNTIRFTHNQRLPQRFQTLAVFTEVEFDKAPHPSAPVGTRDLTMAVNVCAPGGYTLPPGPDSTLSITMEDANASPSADGDAAAADGDGSPEAVAAAAAKKKAAVAARSVVAGGGGSGSANGSSGSKAPRAVFSGASDRTPNARFRDDFWSAQQRPDGAGAAGGVGGGSGGGGDSADGVRLFRRGTANEPLDVFGGNGQKGSSHAMGGRGGAGASSQIFSAPVDNMFAAVHGRGTAGGSLEGRVRTKMLSNNSAINSSAPTSYVDVDDDVEDLTAPSSSSNHPPNFINPSSAATTMSQQQQGSPYDDVIAISTAKNPRSMMNSGADKAAFVASSSPSARAAGGGAGSRARSTSSSAIAAHRGAAGAAAAALGIGSAAAGAGAGAGSSSAKGSGRGRKASSSPLKRLPDTPSSSASRFQRK